jgi:uncharacterized protein (DUF2062 family)
MPSHREVHEIRCLRVFGTLLHDPNLWHLNRRSASGAFAVGLFVMYLPPVGQMIWAAAGAIWFRVNLPISVALVWVSNPVTIPPMFYFAYMVGCWITGHPVPPFEVHFWLDWHNWLGILGPLLLGCLVCASVCSLAGYVGMQALWRWNLMRQIRRRRERYAAAIAARTPSSSRKT